jgi:hypothetical protein
MMRWMRPNVTAWDAASKYPGTQIYHLQQPLNFLLFKWWLGTESNRRVADESFIVFGSAKHDRLS